MSEAKQSALQDDILAVCRLHGYQATPTVQNQLQALDKEFHQLREQGQSSKADYVQTLYLWLSKQTAKVPSSRPSWGKEPKITWAEKYTLVKVALT